MFWGFFQTWNYSINISTFLMNQCSKFVQKTSQFPCHGSSQGDLGEDFPALFFLCYSLFFLSCIFSCTQLQRSKYILLILYTLFSPRKAGITRIQIVLQNNKINLALRIAVLSANGMIQNSIGDIWVSPRLPGKAQWHRLAGAPRWGAKGTAKSCR